MPTRLIHSQTGRFVVAGVLLLGLVFWVGSGDFTISQADGATPLHSSVETALPKVRALRPALDMYQAQLRFQGVTAANRQLTISSERDGIVREMPAKEGQKIAAGTLLAKLDTRQLEAQQQQIKALLRSRELDFKAAQNLQGKGLVADTRFAESASALADAKAQLVTLELALEASEIRAPFAGYLNKVNLELGQYVRDGQAVAELFDFAPTLVRGALTEQQLARLERSATARVRLLNDQEYLAKLHYLGVQTNPETRMTDIELALQQNPPRPVAGITAEVTFDLPAEAAHRISPALFSLDQHGNLGVKVVQPDQRVAFWPTPLLGTDRQGFWIKRLPEDLLLISVGHGYARIGELVEVILGTEVQP